MTTALWLLAAWGAWCGGGVIGAHVVWRVLRKRDAHLRAALEYERTRRTLAEHRLAVWTGLRETSVITVDRRRK